MNGVKQQNTPLIQSLNYEAADPLWKRVPIKDENGKPFADFMPLTCGVRDPWPTHP